MKLALIVAAGNGNVIGKANTLPWYLPEDLKYFKATTLGKPVIMGRKTFESIGKVLPGRANIVVTRQQDWVAPPGVIAASSIEAALQRAAALLAAGQTDADEAMIIGGAEIYQHALPLVERIYFTRIEVDVPDGDAFFPVLQPHEWYLVSDEPGSAVANYRHHFQVYQRAG